MKNKGNIVEQMREVVESTPDKNERERLLKIIKTKDQLAALENAGFGEQTANHTSIDAEKNARMQELREKLAELEEK